MLLWPRLRGRRLFLLSSLSALGLTLGLAALGRGAEKSAQDRRQLDGAGGPERKQLQHLLAHAAAAVDAFQQLFEDEKIVVAGRDYQRVGRGNRRDDYRLHVASSERRRGGPLLVNGLEKLLEHVASFVGFQPSQRIDADVHRRHRRGEVHLFDDRFEFGELLSRRGDDQRIGQELGRDLRHLNRGPRRGCGARRGPGGLLGLGHFGDHATQRLGDLIGPGDGERIDADFADAGVVVAVERSDQRFHLGQLRAGGRCDDAVGANVSGDGQLHVGCCRPRPGSASAACPFGGGQLQCENLPQGVGGLCGIGVLEGEDANLGQTRRQFGIQQRGEFFNRRQLLGRSAEDQAVSQRLGDDGCGEFASGELA